MFVDLNLVRAGMASTPEESDYTSAFDRIRGHAERQRAELGQAAGAVDSAESPDAWLAPLFLDERSDAYPVFDEPSDARDAGGSDGRWLGWGRSFPVANGRHHGNGERDWFSASVRQGFLADDPGGVSGTAGLDGPGASR
jgi:hypothetical protein